jgi:tetratricopeptide (TPR) repeat protein
LYEELDDLVGQGYVHNNIGMAKQVEGDWEAAHRHFLKAMEAAERAGHVVHAAVGRNNIGEIRSDQGRIDEAEPLFRDALRVWRAAKFPALEAHAISNLGRAAARMGNLDQADQLLSEALRRQHEIGVESMAAETDTRLAERALYAGDSEAALATATTTLDTTTQLGGMTALQACLNRIRGYAHMQAGENTLAQDCLDESLRLARQAGAQFELALTLEAWSHLARLTGRRSAAKYAGGAREIFDRLGVVRTPVVPLPG